MSATRIARLLDRMQRTGVASPADCIGCSHAEIGVLEDRYNLRLPNSYRAFLLAMGHRSGRLFRHDHLAVSYTHVMATTGELREMWAKTPPPSSFALPTDCLVIASRLGQQFEFVETRSAEDSAVWYFNDWEWSVRRNAASVYDWLESWCSAAEQAIASGYFDMNPRGTSP